MNLEMACLEIVGLKSDLHLAVRTLQELGCMHVESVREVSQAYVRPLILDAESLKAREQLSVLAAQLGGLAELLKVAEMQGESPATGEVLEEAQAGLAELNPRVHELTARREGLQAELVTLPRYESTLRQLLPILPASMKQPGKACLGVLISRGHTEVLDELRAKIMDLTGGEAELVTRAVDDSTLAMLVVVANETLDEVEAELDSQDLSRLRLPSQLGEGGPDEILHSLSERLESIPMELESIEGQLVELGSNWGTKIDAWKIAVEDRLEALTVLSGCGETEMTFVLLGWVPASKVERVRAELAEKLGERVLAIRLPMTTELRRRAPIALRNPRPARPFETLIRMLSLPRYGRIDPTQMMAFFLPFFFGLMLGDAGYGALLLVLSLLLTMKFKRRALGDFTKIMAAGSVWAIVFGILYGELFGTFGEHQLGMHALWFPRASADQVARLLIIAILVGAVHILLGLILGVYEAIRDRSRSHLLERGGMLLGLVSLFLVVGALVDLLPGGLITPAFVGIILGVVLLSTPMGWLGVLIGPIEFLGLLGNVLSYLRLAAIGLASVYLAEVANQMAGTLGSVLVGGIVALLIHALNLVMGAFSPTIHSLRLHYVEFFRKFYEGGGRAYQPFRSRRLSG